MFYYQYIYIYKFFLYFQTFKISHPLQLKLIEKLSFLACKIAGLLSCKQPYTLTLLVLFIQINHEVTTLSQDV